VLFKLSVMEMGKEDIVAKECVVLIKPKSRLKTQFHSLRRQVYFFQSICVLFCFTSCLYMIISHAYPSTCKVRRIQSQLTSLLVRQ